MTTWWRVGSSWDGMAHGDAREEKWRGNWWMEWLASTLRITSEHGESSVTTAYAHTLAASSRLNWRLRRFKWTRSFRRKRKSGFCARAITFQTQSTYHYHFKRPNNDGEYLVWRRCHYLVTALYNYILYTANTITSWHQPGHGMRAVQTIKRVNMSLRLSSVRGKSW